MSAVSFQLDTQKFTTALHKLVDDLGIAAPVVIRDQTRLLLKDVIKNTPPKDLATGRRRVERDIRRTMTPISLGAFKPRTSERIAQVVAKGDKTALQSILQDHPRYKSWRVENFSPSLHEPFKSRLADKTFKGRKVFIMGTIERAERKSNRPGQTSKRTYFKRSGEGGAWVKYVEQMQKRVGRLKAAWGVAYQQCGGRLPAWVARHTTPNGTCNIDFTNKQKPSITFSNFAFGVGRQRDMFARAMAGRGKAIAGYIKRELIRKWRDR